MSSDDTAGRVTPDLLEQLVTRVPVDELTVASSAFEVNVDRQALVDQTFGKLELPIVFDGEVFYGGEVVEVERVNPVDGGEVLVLDLSKLGWPREKVLAWAIGQHTKERAATVFEDVLVEQLMEIRDRNPEWTDAAGWDAAALDELLDEGWDRTDGDPTVRKAELKPFENVHVLVSFPVGRTPEVLDALASLDGLDGIEVRQSAT